MSVVMLSGFWPRATGQAARDLQAAGRSEPTAALTRGLHGHAVGVEAPVPDHGVSACLFHAHRPFHPQRLHAALDDITDRVLRSRGHFWLASRPDLVMTWESAGGLRLGPVSGWLADLADEQWDAVEQTRRLAAEIDCDPYYGDRHHRLAFIGIDLDCDNLRGVLARCLLTDAELADGEQLWRRLPDPFRRAYPAAAAGSAQPDETNDPSPAPGWSRYELGQMIMKDGIHPAYGYVVFRDRSAAYQFLTRSTATSDKTIQWEDGNVYPVIDVEISAASHPFWTGRSRLLDTAGRVEKFRAKYARAPRAK